MARTLNINFDSLFPGKVVDIAGTKVDIKPLGLAKIAQAVRQLKALGSEFTEAGITWENYNTPQSLFSLAEIIMSAAPSIMEEITDISLEDIQLMPLDVVVELLSVAVDVNMQSKESLEKNLGSLAGKFQKRTGVVKK